MIMAQKAEISIEASGTAGATNNSKGNPPSPKSRLAMLKRTKKASNASSDPFRFQNNGVTYKGKLIGEQDVDKARGDTMCSEAMRNAKGLIKAAGAHKTRVSLQINIDGIKIVDEKSGAVLHNFPVSRISFIARDSTDTRAFGLVYGEPGGKYKFYGIKTAQSADQAVLAIRDMFQVVFEMKKKQLEQVKQQQQQLKSEGNESTTKEGGVAVADLLDLESELHQIEQGVQQLSTVPTNTDAFGATPFGDPFVDSFNSTVNSTAMMNGSNVSALNHGNQSAPTPFSPFGQDQAWPQTAVSAPPPIPQQQPFGNVWGGVAAPAAAAVAFAPNPIQHPMHHAHSTPAFHSIAPPPVAATNGFSGTNPFVAVAFAPAPVIQQQQQSLLMARAPPVQPDPFSTGFTGSVDWNGGATAAMTTTKENEAPNLHHANTFANFGDNNGAKSWEEKRVTSLEEAFTKLVDMDALIGGTAGNETKKNPFEHILNPPKASLNSMTSSCSQMAAAHKPTVTTSADPFGDDPFFR